MKKSQINEVRKFQKIAGILKENLHSDDINLSDTPEFTSRMPSAYEDDNLFLPDAYIQELDQLVKSTLGENPQAKYELSKALLNFIEALEAGWRNYDDTFDGEFDGDDANMDIHDTQIQDLYTGRVITFQQAKAKLDSLSPELSDEIEELFMDGKQEYYSK